MSFGNPCHRQAGAHTAYTPACGVEDRLRSFAVSAVMAASSYVLSSAATIAGNRAKRTLSHSSVDKEEKIEETSIQS